MIEAILQKLDVICAGVCFVFLTRVQQPFVSRIIATSFILFGLLYAFLRSTRILHPPKSTESISVESSSVPPPQSQQSQPKSSHQLKPGMEAEWRSRIVGSVHAIILSIGSILCFLEWNHYEAPEHAWAVPYLGADYYPVKFASIFVGYLQWDLLWLLWHKQTNLDIGSILHHILYISITHYVLYGTYFCRPFAWLSFGEISTPFLHLRWFYAVTNHKENSVYIGSSILFAVTFLISRVFCYGLGLVDIWMARDVWVDLPYGLYGVIGGVHVGYLLNLFWANKVVSALVRTFKKGDRGGSGEKRMKINCG
jgi:hypothetical protein